MMHFLRFVDRKLDHNVFLLCQFIAWRDLGDGSSWSTAGKVLRRWQNSA